TEHTEHTEKRQKRKKNQGLDEVMRTMWRVLLSLFFFSVCSVCSVVSSSAAEPTYWQDVRPVLRKTCTACHNARKVTDLDVSGGLALATYAAVLKGAKEKVIYVGKSTDSPLIKLLLTDATEKRMPLASPPLPAADIELLRRWIDGGAKEGTKP